MNIVKTLRKFASKVAFRLFATTKISEAADDKNAIHVQDFDGCDNVVETASKFGVQVVCDDEE